MKKNPLLSEIGKTEEAILILDRERGGEIIETVRFAIDMAIATFSENNLPAPVDCRKISSPDGYPTSARTRSESARCKRGILMQQLLYEGEVRAGDQKRIDALIAGLAPAKEKEAADAAETAVREEFGISDRKMIAKVRLLAVLEWRNQMSALLDGEMRESREGFVDECAPQSSSFPSFSQLDIAM